MGFGDTDRAWLLPLNARLGGVSERGVPNAGFGSVRGWPTLLDRGGDSDGLAALGLGEARGLLALPLLLERARLEALLPGDRLPLTRVPGNRDCGRRLATGALGLASFDGFVYCLGGVKPDAFR